MVLEPSGVHVRDPQSGRSFRELMSPYFFSAADSIWLFENAPTGSYIWKGKKKKQVKATRQIPKCLMVSRFGKNLISPQGSTLLDTSL